MHLQRDGLAGAGRAGDEAVAVGQRGQQQAFDVAVLGDQERVGHGQILGAGAGVRGAAASVARSARPRPAGSGDPVGRGRRRPTPAGAPSVGAADSLTPSNSMDFLLCCWAKRKRNGLGAAHFLLANRIPGNERQTMDLSLLLERTLPPLGYELVDFETTPKGRLIRVFIDKPEGVDVEDCARVSQHLTRLFAVENIDFDRLEVSSPGLDRPLRKPADFVALRGPGGRAADCCARCGTVAKAEGHRQGLHRRGRADRDGGGRAGGRRSPTSTARASCRRSSGDEHEQFEPGNPAAGRCAGAREERAARTSCSPRSSRRSPPPRRSASTKRSTSRVAIDRETGDYDSFRRWQVVPDEAARGAGAPDRAHRRARAATPTSSSATSSRSRSSRSSSAASARRPPSR